MNLTRRLPLLPRPIKASARKVRGERGASIWRGPDKYLAVAPALILFVIFILYGAFGSVFFSLTKYHVYDPLGQFEFIGLRHYTNLFTQPFTFDRLTTVIGHTLVFSLGVTILQNLIAVGLAVLVNRPLRLKNLYRAIIFFPNIIGLVVIGLIWKLMLSPSQGPVNAFLQRSFNVSSALLGDPNLAMPLVIFVQVWVSVGYAMTIYVAGLQSIPGDLIEAAQIDGASPRQVFRHITLPLLQPAITINFLLSLIGSMRVTDMIYVLTNGGPGLTTQTMALEIFKQVLDVKSDLGNAAAWSNVHFCMVFVVVFFVQRYLRRKERYLE